MEFRVEKANRQRTVGTVGDLKIASRPLPSLTLFTVNSKLAALALCRQRGKGACQAVRVPCCLILLLGAKHRDFSAQKPPIQT